MSVQPGKTLVTILNNSSGIVSQHVTREHKHSTPMSAVVELTSGGVAGAVGILTTQPLDTIRIRLQNPAFGYNGMADALRTTVRNEGMRGLYKGVGSPLATVGVREYPQFTLCQLFSISILGWMH